MTAYRLGNVDCPSCAEGLERGLKNVPGVRTVSVDFGTLSMRVEAADLEAVEAAAKALEPSLVLSRLGAPAEDAESAEAASTRREIVGLTVAVAAALAALALDLLQPFPARDAARAALLAAAYLLSGWRVLLGAGRNIVRGRVFDELFLMGIATLGAIAIGQYEEAIGVMVFFAVGDLLERRATRKSRASVRALLALRPDLARLRRDGAWAMLPPEEAAVGDEFLVKPGERLPLDGRVVEGEAFVDASALTGESMPRRAAPGSELLGGSIAVDGALVLRASRIASESSAARIAALVEDASHAKAKTERWITRFAVVYTPIVVGLAVAAAFLPPLLVPGEELRVWLYRALVMLVVSCPCALVLSIPLGYLGGVGGAARRGILIKGGRVLEALASVGTVAFDKTGTLTKGAFKVTRIETLPGSSEDDLLSLAAAAESLSTHPIAAGIREAARARGLATGTEDEASDLRQLPGVGVVAVVGGRRVAVGNERVLALEGLAPDAAAGGSPAVNVVVDGRLAGRISVGDEAKPDAGPAVRALRDLGVARIAMITGDAAPAAGPMATSIGIDEVYADLLPEGKLETLEGLIAEARARGRGVAFVGDGVNDAPVLALADVGVAMGAGTDAAIESADVVLMTDEPSRVPEAVSRARRTRRIVAQNVVLALGIKAAVIALGAFGLASMWEAVIADVGVALLAVANSLRAMR